jgi:hypothetical protein
MQKRIVAKLVIGMAISAIGIFAADSSVGTWKRNIAKSKGTPPITNPIKSLTLVNETMEGGVTQTATGERQDGTSINGGGSFKYDGQESAVTGAPWDTTSMKQINANTFTVENKNTSGKYHTKGRTVVSKDGKTMTMTAKGTNTEGKPTSFTTIYNKQ